MATFKAIVDEVLDSLSGFGLQRDAAAYLPSSITDSTTSFVLTSTDIVGRGVIEIEDELIWVDAYDANTGTVTIPPYGRGYMGTTAASHAANTMVRVNPTFTRNRVKTYVNDVLRSTPLFGVETATFSYVPTVNTYGLPAATSDILAIKYQKIGPTKESAPIRNYRLDTSANTIEFPTGVTVTIDSPVQVGALVQVLISKDPTPLVADTDVFATVTGLPDSCKDVIVLGACHRLLSFVDPGRLSYETPESDTQSGKIQHGSGTNVAKYIYALFTQRMSEEVGKLQKKHKVRVHYTN